MRVWVNLKAAEETGVMKMLYIFFFFYTEAKGETALQLQSEISSGQDVISINTAQPEHVTVAPKAPTETSVVGCDSQALNMLADLALSAATSSTTSPEPRNLSGSLEPPQNSVLLSKEQPVPARKYRLNSAQ